MNLIQINQLEFPTLELAWEGINEFLINNEALIRQRGGGTYGTEMVSYDNFIHAYKPYIRPDYNFGNILGYRYKKWTKLIGNYINFNYLDLVKAEVQTREKSKSAHYNYTFHFDNAHGSGKDCLISLSFCRRRGQKTPYVIYTTRASEVTSRLIFDFLLIQRLCEYVYGVEKAQTCDVLCYIPFMYVNVERFLFYMGYKGKQVMKKKLIDNRQGSEKFSLFQERIVKAFQEYSTRDPETIKYKVNKRVALQLQMGKDGKPLSKAPDLFARDLTLPYKPIYKDKDIARLNKSIK